MPKIMATMAGIEGRITPIMIWSLTVRPPLPPLLLLLPAKEWPLGLLGEDVEGAGGGVEGMGGDVEGVDEDVGGADAREENGEEDDSLETGLQPSMLYWLTKGLL
jgi:hypothetical protein